jgi:hypothetical protein
MPSEVPPESNDHVTIHVLRNEVRNLKNFFDLRITNVEDKMDRVEAAVGDFSGNCRTRTREMDDVLSTMDTALTLQGERLSKVEKWKEGLASVILKWGSVGVGIALTIALIIAAYTKSRGWW